MKNLRIFYIISLVVLSSTALIQSRTFVHPGLSHKLSDLERMKQMVKLGKEPWKTSFANLQTNSYASYNYNPQFLSTYTDVNVNYWQFVNDGLASYLNALEWYITGDARYAQKCVQIFNNMQNITSTKSGTNSLGAGRAIWKVLEAAEIIKNTYSGWKQEDIDAFKAMLVYPGYSTTVSHEVDSLQSFYWSMYNGDYGRHGNQGLFGMRGVMAMGIFLDNELMYDRALRYLKGEKHRTDDLPYPSGPTIVSSTKNTKSTSYFDDYNLNSPYLNNTIQDYGYNELIKHYIWENGQCQESSRDQGHPLVGIAIVNNISEMAWNQGDDLYSFMDYRTLLGLEYYFRYNLSYLYSFADQSTPWEPAVTSGEFLQRRDRSQRWFSKKINPHSESDTVNITRGTFISDTGYAGGKTPTTQFFLAHYQSRMNLPKNKFKWIFRADSIRQKNFGYEQAGFQVDFTGYGNLTFHRVDSCPGDPVTFVNKVPVYRQNTAPCTIQAEDYDYFTFGGQGRTYNELSGTKIANAYRPDSAVSVKSCSAGGYKVADMASGEWLRYSVLVPEYSKYQISINYSATTSNGKIKLRIGNQDKTTEIALPATGVDVWSDYTLITDTLLSGIRSFQLFVSGTSNTIELNSIKIVKAMIPAKNDYVSNAGGNYNTASNWRLSDGAGGVQASIPTSAPAVTNNVWIQTGHAMTATAAVNAKNLVVSGSLTVGLGTSTAYDITLGSASAPGSLYIQTGGVLSSTTANGGTVGTLKVYGPTISVNGQLGSVNSTTTTGSGIRIYCENEKTTISGSGSVNIARLQSGSSNVLNQDIVIDMDMALMNSSTSGATLSLLNGGAGSAEKTLTINEGRIVKFTGGTAGLLHQQSSATAQTIDGGDINYNIGGTLDTGNGGLYLTTSTLTSSANQKINVNLGDKATLAVGSKFIMIKSQANQAINFNFATGSTVKYASTITPSYSSTAPTGISPASFPLFFSDFVLDNTNGFSLYNSTTIGKSLTFKNGNLTLGDYQLVFEPGATVSGVNTNSHIVTNSTGSVVQSAGAGETITFPVGVSVKRFDPVNISSVQGNTFTVRADSVFSVAPKTLDLTNLTEWTISAINSGSAYLEFTPSILKTMSNPIVAQLINGAWYETDAVLNNQKTFMINTSNFGVFGTGTLTGFGLKSAVTDVDWANMNISRCGNTFFLKGLSNFNELFVYNTLGQQLLHQTINADEVKITIPYNGLIFIQLSSNTHSATLKIMN